MTEINYLPPLEKPNQKIQLDFIGPIRFKHRRFYTLKSIDRIADGQRLVNVKPLQAAQQKNFCNNTSY